VAELDGQLCSLFLVGVDSVLERLFDQHCPTHPQGEIQGLYYENANKINVLC
jgi:hypothetical protein